MATAADDLDIQTFSQKESEKPERDIYLGRPFEVGGTKREIFRIRIDGQDAESTHWKIEDGSSLEIEGERLRFFNRIGFYVGGVFYGIAKYSSQNSGSLISLVVPKYADKFSPNTRLELVFVQDTAKNPNTRFLKNYFYYSADNQEKNDENGKPKSAERLEAEKFARENVRSKILEDVLINGPIGLVGEGLKSGLAPSQTSQPQAASGQSAGTQIEQKTKAAEIEDLNYDDLGEEPENFEIDEEIQTTAQPENITQSAELVGEYIDKNPGVIADLKLRQEVLGALSGNEAEIKLKIGRLSSGARSVLEGVLSSKISGEVTQDWEIQLKTAGDTLRAELNVSAQSNLAQSGSVTVNSTAQGGSSQIQTQANVSARQEVSSSVKADAPTSVKAEVSAEAGKPSSGGANISFQNNIAAKVQAQNSAPAGLAENNNQSAPVPDGISAAPKLSQGESKQAVGEFLSKNPQYFSTANKATQNEILNGLQNGNTENLSPEAKEAYAQTLKNLSQNQAVPSNVKQAADNLIKPEENALPQTGNPEKNKEKKEGVLPENQEKNKEKDEEKPKGQEILDRLKKNDLAQNPVKGLQAQGGLPKILGGSPAPIPSAALSSDTKGEKGVDGINQSAVNRRDGEKIDQATEPKKDIPESLAKTGLQDQKSGTDENQQGEVENSEEKKETRENEEDAEAQQEEERQALADSEFQDSLKESARQQARAKKAAALASKIKVVTAEANLALNTTLLEAATALWAAALPTLGISLLVGAVFGDFLWIFKGRLIRSVLNPLLKTQELKAAGNEISKQIKFNLAVKLNILGMNLACGILIAIFVLIIVIVGCNYPIPDNWATGSRTSIIGKDYPEICKAISRGSSSFNFKGRDSGGAGASSSY